MHFTIICSALAHSTLMRVAGKSCSHQPSIIWTRSQLCSYFLLFLLMINIIWNDLSIVSIHILILGHKDLVSLVWIFQYQSAHHSSPHSAGSLRYESCVIGNRVKVLVSENRNLYSYSSCSLQSVLFNHLSFPSSFIKNPPQNINTQEHHSEATWP